MPITQHILSRLIGICTSDRVKIGLDIDEKYFSDETEDLKFPPEVLVMPASTAEVSSILQLANTHNIAVTCRGAGTGLAGGALPVYGGILMSMEKMNAILEIDESNLQVVVEPGVITEVLQNTLASVGLYYPPDPSSKGSCYIGGNVATNAGGPRAVKYGVVKDYVLNLQVVLADGSVIWTGANTLKNSTGYNLTSLFVGSEGTLGIITKIVLKLVPLPKYQLLMMAPFGDPYKACEAVSAIFRAGITPSAIEFMEREAIQWSLAYIGRTLLPENDPTQAHLLIEVDGNHMEALYKDVETIHQVLERFEAGDVLFADDEKTKNELWLLRRNVAHAVKKNSIYKEEDTVVPRANLPDLLKKVKELGTEYGFKSVCYGHAGDGNLHVNIVKGQMDIETWNTTLPIAIRSLFLYVKSLGGTLSGEHGIGWVQKEYLDTVMEQSVVNIQKNLKKLLDPKGILNPGKIFP